MIIGLAPYGAKYFIPTTNDFGFTHFASSHGCRYIKFKRRMMKKNKEKYVAKIRIK